jgi:hypothetical protein
MSNSSQSLNPLYLDSGPDMAARVIKRRATQSINFDISGHSSSILYIQGRAPDGLTLQMFYGDEKIRR